MGTPNKERQRQWRERQKAQHGRTAHTFICTDEEAFYMERTLLALRKGEGVPAMVRNAKGQLKALDA